MGALIGGDADVNPGASREGEEGKGSSKLKEEDGQIHHIRVC